MLLEEALDMRSKVIPGGAVPVSAPKSRAIRGSAVQFRAIAGPDNGSKFQLDLGTCRAMGRAVGDPNKTSVLNVGLAISLDEETKGLVLQYIGQQFRRSPRSEKEAEDSVTGRLGAFKRGPDVILKDQALSRLHAMIFYDEMGIGILDLVSKNGTFINGEEVESRLLKKGDTLELGETKIVFEG